ncbi:MAG: MBL fold metallo-hydrolase [Rhodospirillaceae bacterium]
MTPLDHNASPDSSEPLETRIRLTVLGCGGSTGVPSIYFGWGNCDPANPRNRRSRASIMVELVTGVGEQTIVQERVVVDTGPDFREQMLRAEVRHIDAILYTHEHADHTHGIDDVRDINRTMGQPMPMWMNQATHDVLTNRFRYIFSPLDKASSHYYKPQAQPSVAIPGETFQVGALPILPFDQDHGWIRTLGFVFGGKVAYSTDVKALDEAAFAALEGVDLWVLNSATDKEHPTHAHLDLALEWVDRVKPKQTILTHLGTGMDYETMRQMLPAEVIPGFDGLVVEQPVQLPAQVY